MNVVGIVNRGSPVEIRGVSRHDFPQAIKSLFEPPKTCESNHMINQMGNIGWFEVVFSSIGDAVILTDGKGQVIYLNPAAEAITGWNEDALGKNLPDVFFLVDELTRQAVENPFVKVTRDGTAEGVAEHAILIRRDGSQLRVEASGAHIRDKVGKFDGVVFVLRDITERKEIEAGLEKTRKELEVIKRSADESLEYAESIINTVREPLIALDQDLRVVTASRSFYQVFKVNHEETVGQLIYDLGNKQWDIPKLRELLENILPHKATFDDYEVDHDFSTIGRRIMLLNARQIQRGLGKERIILLAIEDITERRQVENALHSAKLAVEAASRAKSEFVANMSHELRTPLNSIIGFSEVLQDQAFGPLTPKQTRYVVNVLTAGYHLLSLINDILDLSKVEAGKMTIDARTFALKPMMGNALILVKERVMKQGLTITLEVPSDLSVCADERMFKQILFNLLSNAVKFTEPGGRINLDARRAGENLLVCVADTGIGIKADDRARLFKEFEQLDSGFDRIHQGTGLGLALTRKFVELHGGSIWAESEGEGKGTTFCFTLPLAREGFEIESNAAISA